MPGSLVNIPTVRRQSFFSDPFFCWARRFATCCSTAATRFSNFRSAIVNASWVTVAQATSGFHAIVLMITSHVADGQWNFAMMNAPLADGVDAAAKELPAEFVAEVFVEGGHGTPIWRS